MAPSYCAAGLLDGDSGYCNDGPVTPLQRTANLLQAILYCTSREEGF